ncbi:MAG: PEP-CTERM sorting domain-containing protein [Burkholderiales bacterium]|nr:MAG: PEP-CTERM sorting domain-containing protein [Burkholderiales bacterium]
MPEPATFALLGIGVAGLAATRRPGPYGARRFDMPALPAGASGRSCDGAGCSASSGRWSRRRNSGRADEAALATSQSTSPMSAPCG